jgi:hypothetical protein
MRFADFYTAIVASGAGITSDTASIAFTGNLLLVYAGDFRDGVIWHRAEDRDYVLAQSLPVPTGHGGAAVCCWFGQMKPRFRDIHGDMRSSCARIQGVLRARNPERLLVAHRSPASRPRGRHLDCQRRPPLSSRDQNERQDAEPISVLWWPNARQQRVLARRLRVAFPQTGVSSTKRITAINHP